MINFKQKIINNVEQEYKELIKECNIEFWENKSSPNQEFMLNIYGEDEIIKELFEAEFDYILLKIFSNYNIVFINFNSVELDELNNAIDNEIDEMIENEEIEKQRKNLEYLYKNE